MNSHVSLSTAARMFVFNLFIRLLLLCCSFLVIRYSFLADLPIDRTLARTNLNSSLYKFVLLIRYLRIFFPTAILLQFACNLLPADLPSTATVYLFSLPIRFWLFLAAHVHEPQTMCDSVVLSVYHKCELSVFHKQLYFANHSGRYPLMDTTSLSLPRSLRLNKLGQKKKKRCETRTNYIQGEVRNTK